MQDLDDLLNIIFHQICFLNCNCAHSFEEFEHFDAHLARCLSFNYFIILYYIGVGIFYFLFLSPKKGGGERRDEGKLLFVHCRTCKCRGGGKLIE